MVICSMWRGAATVALACALTALCVNEASATLLAEEDFDGYDAARTRADDADPIAWRVLETELDKNGEPDRVQVVDVNTVPTPPSPHSPPNALKIATSTPSDKGSKEVQVHLMDSGGGREGQEILTIDFWVYRADSGGSAVFLVGAGGRGGYTGHIINIYLRPDNKILDRWMKVLASSAERTWEHYRIVARSSTDTYDFYLNDMDTPRKTGVPFATPVQDWAEANGGMPVIVISQNPSEEESVIYIDDLRMSSK